MDQSSWIASAALTATVVLAAVQPAEPSPGCMTLTEARASGPGWPRWKQVHGRRCWYVNESQLKDLRAARRRPKVVDPDPTPTPAPEPPLPPKEQPARVDLTDVPPPGDDSQARLQRALEDVADRMTQNAPPIRRSAEDRERGPASSGVTPVAPQPSTRSAGRDRQTWIMALALAVVSILSACFLVASILVHLVAARRQQARARRWTKICIDGRTRKL